MDRRLIQRFWDACGAIGPMEIRVERESGGGGSRQIVPGPFAVIGRNRKADVVLEGMEVSQHHVYIQVIHGRIFWLDLGSRGGVVAGGIVSPMGWLGKEGVIGIGPYRLTITVKGVSIDDAIDWPSPLADRGPTEWPDATFEFPHHPGKIARWRIAKILTLVGRGADCRLRIGDHEISRYHCALVRTPKGPWVVDLLSRKGVRLEGARVRFARLEFGANLHIGRYRMIVRSVETAPMGNDEEPMVSVSPLPREQLPEVASSHRPPAMVVEQPAVELSAMTSHSGDLEAYIGRLERMQQHMFDQFHQMMMAMFQAFGSMQQDQMTQVREELDRIRDLGQELRLLQETATASTTGVPQTAKRSTQGGDTANDLPADRPTPAPWQPRNCTDQEVHDLICRRISEIEGERQGRWKRVLDLVKGGPTG